jgi:hypothetical protein
LVRIRYKFCVRARKSARTWPRARARARAKVIAIVTIRVRFRAMFRVIVGLR